MSSMHHAKSTLKELSISSILTSMFKMKLEKTSKNGSESPTGLLKRASKTVAF